MRGRISASDEKARPHSAAFDHGSAEIEDPLLFFEKRDSLFLWLLDLEGTCEVDGAEDFDLPKIEGVVQRAGDLDFQRVPTRSARLHRHAEDAGTGGPIGGEGFCPWPLEVDPHGAGRERLEGRKVSEMNGKPSRLANDEHGVFREELRPGGPTA